MFDLRQVGRESRLQIIIHRASGEAFPLPKKIVVMRDGRKPGLADHFRHRQAQRHVHREREDVLWNQHFQLKFFDEAINFVLELLFNRLHPVRHRARPSLFSE